MSRYFLLIVGFLYLFGSVQSAVGQELNCDVSADYSLLSERYTYLAEFERDVEEYLNQHAWTDDTFLEHERIDCSVTITFTEATAQDAFSTNLVVVSRRPIYGTTQSSTVVRFNDEGWSFGYTQGTPLIHDPNSIDDITSVLDYYAYLILGYDYDTFSELGGTTYFEKARTIAEKARSRGGTGWSTMGSDRGRLDLVSQLLDARFRPLRLAYFTYHFGGLDRFVTKTDTSRAAVLGALESIDDLYQQLSRQYTIDLFFSAKNTELAAIFEESSIRGEAFEILTGLDPSNTSIYQRLIQ